MGKKPKIKIKPTSTDIIVEIIGWLTLGILWVETVSNYSNMVNTNSAHLNVAVQTSHYGDKGTILFLPILGTLLFVGMTIMNKFPYLFNISADIATNNVEKEYANTTRMIRYLKFAIVLVFAFVVNKTSHTALTNSDVLGTWFLPLILVLILIPLIFYIVDSFKVKRKKDI